MKQTEPKPRVRKRARINDEQGRITKEKIEALLPDNYWVESWVADTEESHFYIHGHDVAGWTLDGYVIPRLASGMIFAVEVTK
jgi:hypothetical protein